MSSQSRYKTLIPFWRWIRRWQSGPGANVGHPPSFSSWHLMPLKRRLWWNKALERDSIRLLLWGINLPRLDPNQKCFTSSTTMVTTTWRRCLPIKMPHAPTRGVEESDMLHCSLIIGIQQRCHCHAIANKRSTGLACLR
jgi:hypothetical protein